MENETDTAARHGVKIGKTKIVALLVALAALAGGTLYLWSIQENPKERREACKKAAREAKACKAGEVVPYLRSLFNDRALTSRISGKFPWLRISYGPKVPVDFISQITEDALYRLAGRGTAETTDVPNMKTILAFTYEIYPECSKDAQTSLRQRQIDACFFLNDFDGAIKLIEPGLPGHSKEWTRGTVAKLRAHKAMLAGDHKEVVKQLLIFGEYLQSDEMKDRDDEYDQTTGVMYSPQWVLGRNHMRCSLYSAKAGDMASAKKYLDLAQPLLIAAIKKAKDDKTTRDELLREREEFKTKLQKFKLELAPLEKKTDSRKK